MPQTHDGAVPPLIGTTADKAVIRLHGRNELWAGASKEERYRYEYSVPELAAWADRAHRLAQATNEVHVVVNTCCAGAAQRAAAVFRDRIGAMVGD